MLLLTRLIEWLFDGGIVTETAQDALSGLSPTESAAAARYALDEAIAAARHADAQAKAAWEVVARMQAKHIQAQIAARAA